MYLLACSVMQELIIPTAVQLISLTVSHVLLERTAILEQLTALSVDLGHTTVVRELLAGKVVMFVDSVLLELSIIAVVLLSAINVMQEHTTSLMVQHLLHNAQLVMLVHMAMKQDRARKQLHVIIVLLEHTAPLVAQQVSRPVLSVQQEHIPIHLRLMPYHNVEAVLQEHTAMQQVQQDTPHVTIVLLVHTIQYQLQQTSVHVFHVLLVHMQILHYQASLVYQCVQIVQMVRLVM